MSDFTDEDGETAIDALDEAHETVYHLHASECCMELGKYTRAVLAAVFPAHDRRVKAETLAELIEAMEAMSLPTQVPPHLTLDWFTGYENADREFTDWLRRRLAAIENGADDEPR